MILSPMGGLLWRAPSLIDLAVGEKSNTGIMQYFETAVYDVQCNFQGCQLSWLAGSIIKVAPSLGVCSPSPSLFRLDQPITLASQAGEDL
jgi:hypothetical protein